MKIVLTVCAKLTNGETQFSTTSVSMSSTISGENFICTSCFWRLGAIISKTWSNKHILCSSESLSEYVANSSKWVELCVDLGEADDPTYKGCNKCRWPHDDLSRWILTGCVQISFYIWIFFGYKTILLFIVIDPISKIKYPWINLMNQTI